MRFSELMRRIGEAEFAGADPEVKRICEDSRKAAAGDLFVARGGTKVDGAKFIADAVAKGAVAVVMGNDGRGIAIPRLEVPVAAVGDVNAACALLAHELAGRPTAGMKMIGITGTKGKTTVAYLLRSVLKAAGHKVGMIGTVEIDDGAKVVPAEMTTPGAVELVEMFCRMRENGVTHCVMEVSSHALHQHRVAGIDWAVAIFTNLTGDHLDYHKTMEEYAAAKAILFEGLNEGAVAVVNLDDKWAPRMIRDCRAQAIPFCIAKYAPPNGWAGDIVRMNAERMDVALWSSRPKKVPPPSLLSYFHRNIETKRLLSVNLRSPLVGRHNAYNLMCVVAAAQALGVSPGRTVEILRDERGAPGRLQRVEVEATFSVFVDYAHTHDALENVLTALRATMGSANQSRDREGAVLGGGTGQPLPDGRGSDVESRLICVFGCGGDRDRTKRPKMGAIAERLADRVIVTSDNPRTEEPGGIIEEICKGFSEGWREGGKIAVEADRRAAIRAAIGMARAGDVVLIAGKGHENYQIIGTTKHHFDDVEEAAAAMATLINHQDIKAPR